MKILIIEDDRVMRILLRRILQREPSYELIEAVDGLAAWFMLQEGLMPDLCLLDVMMPRMDGIEFLEKIRGVQKFKGLRVIVCSAVNDRARITHASSLEILSYIVKPFVAAKVLDQVQKALKPLEKPRITAASLESEQRLRQDASRYLDTLKHLAQTTQTNLSAMQEALNKGDHIEAQMRAGLIKYESRNQGITGLMRGAANLEEALRSRNSGDLQSSLAIVQTELKTVLETVDRLSSPPTSSATASPALSDDSPWPESSTHTMAG